MLTLALALCLAQDPAPRFAGYPEQDALSYRIHLDVDPAGKKLEGSVGYRFRAARALDRILLDAVPGPDWKVTFRDPDGAELRTEWSEDRAVVHLGREVAAGQTVELTAELAGTPPDGFYFKDSRYGEPLAFTDHYSIRARGWLPCEDHPGDRAAFAVELTFPDGDQALASGAILAEEPGRLSTETRSDIPPYMFAIVVGPFVRVAEEGDDRLAPHFVYREDREKAEPLLVHHAEWIEIMERRVGPYPYAKYTVVQCPTRWGGFEAPGNVQLSEGIFDRGGVGTMAHELAHMWFGDGIGYAEWREVWLSEGFASYFGPWLHAQTGGPSFRDSLKGMRERWLRSREGLTRSIRWDGFAHPDLALNSNTYPKGAWVLHMLRGEVGDEAFWDAIASYYARHKGTSIVTRDLVASFEESTGRELDWFFDQWLERVGCPELEVEARDGGIVVAQVQQAVPFRFLLTLGWTDAGGERQQRTFRIEGRRTELEVPGGVAELAVDPDVELLYR